MSEDAAPERIAVNWSPEARADLRAKTQTAGTGFRLRCGDYRVFFDRGNLTTIEITVRHRREAYR